jgi:hypothetical protein
VITVAILLRLEFCSFIRINDVKEQFARSFDHSACLISEAFIKAKIYTRVSVTNVECFCV